MFFIEDQEPSWTSTLLSLNKGLIEELVALGSCQQKKPKFINTLRKPATGLVALIIFIL